MPTDAESYYRDLLVAAAGESDELPERPESMGPAPQSKPKSPRDGCAEDLSRAWDSAEARSRESEDLARAWEPHRKDLADAGETPASVTQKLIAEREELARDPYAAAERHEAYRDSVDASNGTEEEFNNEWARYCQRVPDAEQFRVSMGRVLTAYPPQEGESTQQAFDRARTTVQNHVELNQEWETLCKEHPEAQGLQEEMAKEARVRPLKKGESIRDGLRRAYNAVKPKPEPKSPSGSASWRHGLEAAYGQIERSGR